MLPIERPPRTDPNACDAGGGAAPASPSQPLFRAAAVAFHGAHTFGNTRLVHGVPVGALTALLTAIACAAVAFATLGHYARKEQVTGFLEPDRGIIRVFAPHSGVVSELFVGAGDSVRRGALLFNVVDLQSLPDGADADRATLQRFAAERAELAAVRAREPARAAAEVAALRAQLATLDRQLGELAQWIAVQTEQNDLAAAQLDALEPLHTRGAIATVDWLAQRERLLQPRERLQSTRQARARLEGERAALTAQLARAPFDSADRTADTDARLAALERAEIAVVARREFAVRAPLDGRVVAVLRKVGDAAAPNEVALTVLPDGSTLIGRALVPATAIGFVAAGQPVRVRYDAFPHQHFGVQQAVVRDVARGVLFEGDAYGPLRVTAPAYPATLTLAAQSITVDGRAVPLRSGMSFSADVVLERRRIIGWLFEPLLRLRGRT